MLSSIEIVLRAGERKRASRKVCANDTPKPKRRRVGAYRSVSVAMVMPVHFSDKPTSVLTSVSSNSAASFMEGKPCMISFGVTTVHALSVSSQYNPNELFLPVCFA